MDTTGRWLLGVGLSQRLGPFLADRSDLNHVSALRAVCFGTISPRILGFSAPVSCSSLVKAETSWGKFLSFDEERSDQDEIALPLQPPWAENGFLNYIVDDKTADFIVNLLFSLSGRTLRAMFIFL